MTVTEWKRLYCPYCGAFQWLFSWKPIYTDQWECPRCHRAFTLDENAISSVWGCVFGIWGTVLTLLIAEPVGLVWGLSTDGFNWRSLGRAVIAPVILAPFGGLLAALVGGMVGWCMARFHIKPRMADREDDEARQLVKKAQARRDRKQRSKDRQDVPLAEAEADTAAAMEEVRGQETPKPPPKSSRRPSHHMEAMLDPLHAKRSEESEEEPYRMRFTTGFLAAMCVAGGVGVLLLAGLVVLIVRSHSRPTESTPSRPANAQANPPAGFAKPPTAQPPAPPKTQPVVEKGPFQYLADAAEFDVKNGPWPFTKNGTVGDGKTPIQVNGIAFPKALGMHPPDLSYSAVKYRLQGGATTFKAAVALNDSARLVLSAAVFEVLGDGRSLWKSAPVARAGQPQEFAVDVAGVDVLELRVHGRGSHIGLHAVWLDPRVLLKDSKAAP